MATILPLPPPVQAPPAMVKAAQDFEATTLTELLQPMFDTVDTADGPFGGGDGEQAWRPMLVQAIAKQIAADGGIGIAGPVLQEMIRMQEKRA